MPVTTMKPMAHVSEEQISFLHLSMKDSEHCIFVKRWYDLSMSGLYIVLLLTVIVYIFFFKKAVQNVLILDFSNQWFQCHHLRYIWE